MSDIMQEYMHDGMQECSELLAKLFMQHLSPDCAGHAREFSFPIVDPEYTEEIEHLFQVRVEYIGPSTPDPEEQ